MQTFPKPLDNFNEIKRFFLYVLLTCLSKFVSQILFGFLILMFFMLERQISVKNTSHLLLEGLLIGIGCTLAEYWYIRLYRLFAPTFIHTLLAFGINFILGVGIAVSYTLLLLPQGTIESMSTLVLYVMICALSGGLLLIFE